MESFGDSGQPHQNYVQCHYLCAMRQDISQYFEEVTDPRVVGRCDHLLSDILINCLMHLSDRRFRLSGHVPVWQRARHPITGKHPAITKWSAISRHLWTGFQMSG